MVLYSKVNLLTTILKVTEPISGQMEKSTPANGKPIKCMVKGNWYGQMVSHIKVALLMIYVTEMGISNGQTVVYIVENGNSINNMVLVLLLLCLELKNKESG